MDPLIALLDAFTPADDAEAADVARVREIAAGGDPWGRGTPLHVTGSALVIHPPSGRVLLRWHGRMQSWLQVGGHGDPGETDPYQVALREAREETGLADLRAWPDPAHPAAVQVVCVPVPPGKGEPAHEHADVRYLLATDRPEAAVQEHETALLAWHTVDEAIAQVEEENLRVCLRRVKNLLDAGAPRRNEQGQPIGPPLPGWTPRPRPPRTPMVGRYCRVEPLDVERHAADLWQAVSLDEEGGSWTYLTVGPFADEGAFRDWLARVQPGEDPLFHAIVDSRTQKAVGFASFMRIDPPNGVIEVGSIHYSPLLQRTRAATEAMYLMMRRAFDELGYRRYEWKCDAFNAPSRAAAVRYGFQFEGIFRQAVVYKGRSRDTAWFSIVDAEWPRIRSAFERWLDPANFDADGRQRTSLSDLTRAARG